MTFDAPSDEKTGKVFKNVDDCYNFQDWLIAYDKRSGPRHKVIDADRGLTRHDSLLFSIIRNKYFFQQGKSTKILEMLANIPKESRRYPSEFFFNSFVVVACDIDICFFFFTTCRFE